MIVESHDTITETWISGTERLIEAGGDAFTSILHVRRPAEPGGVELAARLLLDDVLTRTGAFDTEAVANTIFPHAMARNRTAEELYQRYLTRTYPRLRRLVQNRRGTYFHRLVYHQGVDSHGNVSQRNPLSDVIGKMRGALGEPRTIRSAYELAIYRPSLDANMRMAFPCLSHISLKLDPGARLLHLSAIYRNQYYVARAYGNLLGLSRLQAFIAGELGLGVGELLCHATHAHLDGSVRAINALLVNMSQALVGARPGQAAVPPLQTSVGG
jgi:hypothetical protein